MGVLASVTYDMAEGLTYIHVGLFQSNIVAVHRTGAQYDRVSNSQLNNGNQRQWSYNPFQLRVKFPTALPANPGGEKVTIIYKPVV